MNKVVISHDEVISAPQPWPGASLANIIAVLMARKGLKLRPSFDPQPEDLLPPWRVEQDPVTRGFTVWQGDLPQTSAPAI